LSTVFHIETLITFMFQQLLSVM